MTFCREKILRDLSDPPDAGWVARAVEHARDCARCADLLPFLEPRPPELPPSVDAPRELFSGVMAATGGDAGCRAARDRLAGAAPDGRGAPDAALDGHLADCAGCRAFAGALVALDAVLPGLTVVDPGPAFTRAVLRRTSAAFVAPSAAGLSLPAWLAHLLARPRFALEFAYAGALVAWLVAGAAGLSLATPAHWLAEEPAQAFRRVGAGLEALPVHRVDEAVDLGPVRADLRRRYSGTREVRRHLADSRRDLAASLSRADFPHASHAAGELLLGIVRLPGRFLQKPEGARGATRNPQPNDEPEAGRQMPAGPETRRFR